MNNDDMQETTRRGFMARIAAIGAGALMGGAMFPQFGQAALQDKKTVLTTVKLAEHEALAEIGGSILIKGTEQGDILVVRAAKDKYTAMSNICPHKECKVKVKSAELIQCPCHKSAYSIEGKYQSGPAKKDLLAFPVALKDGVLTVYAG
ncbi:MAG: Rieske (2Fe-2S) protein [Ignavibacteriae bacterium]|nr:Rieske (2Fe-2S) protein [Ignavibacteriota bacterium]